MLSGGYSPTDNNYSQYLQARAMVAFFELNYPGDPAWVFFGAGNVEGQPPIFGDVRREQAQGDGVKVNAWLPGALKRNRPARRETILRAFREEILPTVAGGGTLFLFVGDHGSQARGEPRESVIDLWTIEPDDKSKRGWKSSKDETLGVAELGRILTAGLGKGRVVFCMTQCHSGGFHFLAVPRQMNPNPKWFSAVPDWVASPQKQTAFPRVAGFSATDERSLAAGCQADPDPVNWEGYERYLPEKLLGLDLFTLKPAGKGLRSLAEAHAAAVLMDRTVDKPYSTSEQYLERWASLIETRLMKETNLTAKVKKQIEVYERAVNGRPGHPAHRQYRERQALYHRFVQQLGEQNPAVKQLVKSGTQKELETEIGGSRGRRQANQTPQQPPGPRPGRGRRGGQGSETRKLWNETIRPGWKRDVEAGEPGVLAGAVEFEKHLLKLESEGKDFLFGDPDALDEEVFWNSGYSNPQTVDLPKAEAVARWGVQRRAKILEWARGSNDVEIRKAGEAVSQNRRRPAPPAPPSQAEPEPGGSSLEPIAKRVAAERALFYRRVLAAWEFLLALNERPALQQVRDLIDLESTPLPRPGRKS